MLNPFFFRFVISGGRTRLSALRNRYLVVNPRSFEVVGQRRRPLHQQVVEQRDADLQ